MCIKDGWLVYNLDADAMVSSLAVLTANKQEQTTLGATRYFKLNLPHV